MTDQELKPCPFCGTQPILYHQGKNGVVIKCPECTIKYEQKYLHKTEAWLIGVMTEQWNKRAESQAKDTRIKELEAEVKEMEKHVLGVHDKASDITDKCIADVKKEMMAFTEWAADCDYNHHDQDNYWQKFDWDCGSGTGPKLTTAELLTEYKKQLTK